MRKIRLRRKNDVKILNENKGITLVALIVTIIVMLVLAGVSMNAVIGENGILSQAIAAAEATEDAEFNEDAEMILLQASQMVLDGATDEEIQAYLEKAFASLRIKSCGK